MSSMQTDTPLPLPLPLPVAYSLNGNRYLNVTNRCTLRCAFCPKFNGSWNVRGHELRLRREPSAADLVDAVGDPQDYSEIVFCGLGEPLLALDRVLAAARALKEMGGYIRINTDGLANLVQGRDITPALEGCVDALSISLNAQDEPIYDRHCRPPHPGCFQAVQDFARCARECVPEVTLTAIDGLEGVDIAACEAIAERLGVNFRRRLLDEVG